MLNRINQLREALAKLQAEFFKYKALIEGSMIDVLKRKKDDDDENDRDRENKKKEREQMQLTFEAKINSLKTELNQFKAENDKLKMEKNEKNDCGEAELNNLNVLKHNEIDKIKQQNIRQESEINWNFPQSFPPSNVELDLETQQNFAGTNQPLEDLEKETEAAELNNQEMGGEKTMQTDQIKHSEKEIKNFHELSKISDEKTRRDTMSAILKKEIEEIENLNVLKQDEINKIKQQNFRQESEINRNFPQSFPPSNVEQNLEIQQNFAGTHQLLGDLEKEIEANLMREQQLDIKQDQIMDKINKLNERITILSASKYYKDVVLSERTEIENHVMQELRKTQENLTKQNAYHGKRYARSTPSKA